jgi:hypothetical protein
MVLSPIPTHHQQNQGDGSLKLKHLIKEEKGKQPGATQEEKGK